MYSRLATEPLHSSGLVPCEEISEDELDVLDLDLPDGDEVVPPEVPNFVVLLLQACSSL